MFAEESFQRIHLETCGYATWAATGKVKLPIPAAAAANNNKFFMSDALFEGRLKC